MEGSDTRDGPGFEGSFSVESIADVVFLIGRDFAVFQPRFGNSRGGGRIWERG